MRMLADQRAPRADVPASDAGMRAPSLSGYSGRNETDIPQTMPIRRSSRSAYSASDCRARAITPGETVRERLPWQRPRFEHGRGLCLPRLDPARPMAGDRSGPGARTVCRVVGGGRDALHQQIAFGSGPASCSTAMHTRTLGPAKGSLRLRLGVKWHITTRASRFRREIGRMPKAWVGISEQAPPTNVALALRAARQNEVSRMRRTSLELWLPSDYGFLLPGQSEEGYGAE